MSKSVIQFVKVVLDGTFSALTFLSEQKLEGIHSYPERSLPSLAKHRKLGGNSRKGSAIRINHEHASVKINTSVA